MSEKEKLKVGEILSALRKLKRWRKEAGEANGVESLELRHVHAMFSQEIDRITKLLEDGIKDGRARLESVLFDEDFNRSFNNEKAKTDDKK